MFHFPGQGIQALLNNFMTKTGGIITMMRTPIRPSTNARSDTFRRLSVITDVQAAETLGDQAKVLSKVMCLERGYHLTRIVGESGEDWIEAECDTCKEKKRFTIEQFLEGYLFIW